MISGAYPDLEGKLCRAPFYLVTSFDKGIAIIYVMLDDTGSRINSFL